MDRPLFAIAISAVLGVLLAGCGDDDGGGGGNTAGAGAGGAGQDAAGAPQVDSGPELPAGTSTADFTATNVVAGTCQHVPGGAASATCEGVEEFTTCVLAACPAADYAECWGANYAQNDTSGGPCDAFADCVLGSADHCSHACMPDGACLSCLGMGLGQCVQATTCAAPTCTADD